MTDGAARQTRGDDDAAHGDGDATFGDGDAALGDLKVCHLITDLEVGGAEQALTRFVLHPRCRSLDQRVACLFGGAGELANKLREQSVPVVDMGMTAKWRIDALARIFRWLRRERPSILHCWMFHANVTGRFLGRLAGTPIVISSRRIDKLGSPLRERVNRWTSRYCDRTIAVAECVREIEIRNTGSSPDRVVTIHNGLELDDNEALTGAQRQRLRSQWNVDDSHVLLGVVARFRPQKALEDLIDAFALLHQRQPHARLLMVGDGSTRAQLELQVAALGLREVVHFTGLRSDATRLMQTLDLFVLSSHWEGLPNVVLEAMWAGLPVVATRVGGSPEVVEDGETGMLVEPGSPQSLADAAESYVVDADRRRRAGKAGKARVREQFSLDATVSKTIALYQSLLSEKQLHEFSADAATVDDGAAS